MKNENTNEKTQKLVSGNVIFERVQIVKRGGETVVNGDVTIDEKEVGSTSMGDKAMHVKFNNFTVFKNGNSTRVNGTINVTGGERTLEEMFHKFMKHF